LGCVSMLGNLSPVSHYSNPNLYRVPLERTGNHYTIYVADNFVRNFTDETLPDEVKTKLSMIVAASKTEVRDWEFYNSDVYVPKHPMDGFEDIGWQVSDSYFCICMSTELLNELRGEDDS
jgi:hypothetical protein